MLSVGCWAGIQIRVFIATKTILLTTELYCPWNSNPSLAHILLYSFYACF